MNIKKINDFPSISGFLSNDDIFLMMDNPSNSSAATKSSSLEVLKQNIYNSPTFTGTPLAPTAPNGTNSDQVATTSFVKTEISNLVDSAPDLLNTLNELAEAIDNDANFATTITSGLATVSGIIDDVSGVLRSDLTVVSGLLLTVNVNGVIDGQYLVYSSGTDDWIPTSNGNFSELNVSSSGNIDSLQINSFNHSNLSTASGLSNNDLLMVVVDPTGSSTTEMIQGSVLRSSLLNQPAQLQFRQGIDAERLLITPASGEPIWTTDTQKFYIGDGTTVGGDFIGPSPYDRGVGTQSIVALNSGCVASGDYSVVGGGSNNTASSGGSTVSGGSSNTASGGNSAVGGGSNNTASGNNSTVGGGQNNTASAAVYSTVGGGAFNTASGPIGSTVGGGRVNTASSYDSTVGGGSYNTASGNYNSTVGGGNGNTANNNYSTVGGGYYNTASSYYGTVSGGQNNIASGSFGSTVSGGIANKASGSHSTVGGGKINTASNNYSTVGGGYTNTADGEHSTVAGGMRNLAKSNRSFVTGTNNVAAQKVRRANNITSSTNTITVLNATAADFNDTTTNAVEIRYFYNNNWNKINRTVSSATQSGSNVTLVFTTNVGATSQTWTHVSVVNVAETDSNLGQVVNGVSNLAIGSYSAAGGGNINTASGNYSTVGGGQNNTASGSSSTVGGGQSNTAAVLYGTVGGGAFNTASGPIGSTVGGGRVNSASGYDSIVGGGYYNSASNYNSTVGGGNNNSASGYSGTVGGGYRNTASGNYSTVGGGFRGKATRYGENSHAAGRFINDGDAQHTVLIARRTTSNNTANQVLFLDGSSARLTLPAETTWTFEVKLSAYNDTDNAAAGWIYRGVIRRDAANSTVLVGSLIEESWKESAMDSTSASVVADDTNEALEIRVTGLTGKNIRWVAVVDISQVSYGTP